MKGYKLVKDHPDHVEIMHPEGQTFKVAKNGLSTKMMSEISKMPKHMDEGGEADDPEDTTTPIKDTGGGVSYAPGGDSLLGTMGSSVVDYLKALPEKVEKSLPKAKAEVEEKLDHPEATEQTAAPSPIVQTSMVPEEMPQQQGQVPPGVDPYNMDTVNAAFEAEKKANLQGAGLGGEQAKILGQQTEALQKQQKTFELRLQHLNDEGDKIQKAYADGKIDPNRMWDNASTGSKLAMIAGIIVSGFGAGDTGHNLGMDVVNKAIDKDIASQRDNLDKQSNLFKMNLEKHGNLLAAENATRSNLLSAFKAQVDIAALKSGSAQAMARAKQLNAQIDMQKAVMNRNTAIQSSQFQQFAPSGQVGQPTQPGAGSNLMSGIDANKFRAGLALGILPKEQAMKEYAQYNAQKQQVDTVDQAFDKVKELQNLGNRLGDPVQSKKQIDSTVKAYSTVLAKDLEGRATPQDIDSMASNFSEIMDSDATDEQKKENLKNLIKMKGSFPIMTSYGVLNPKDPYINTTGTLSAKVKQSFKPAKKPPDLVGQDK